MQCVVWCSWKSSVLLDRKAIYSLVWLEMWYCAVHLCWAAFTTTHVKHAPMDPRSFLQKKCQFETFSWQSPKSDAPSCLDVRIWWYFSNFDFQVYDACVFVQTRPCFLRQWSCSKTVYIVNSWSLVHGVRIAMRSRPPCCLRKRVLTRGPKTSWCLRHVARGRWSVETPGNKASCNMM